ncbi:cardiolipin synthase [Aporhodopirellula aestuarii]|uniref:cardiolipin synthase n=1 Tax=Aporhodopirellula aestuarii TaxID=2950107 RepID=UPI002033F4D0|nr:cardiolipin synthase [Aporhodopirellula aestuarii]
MSQALANGWGLLLPALFVLLQLFAALSALHAIRNVRTSQAAVAWTVGLLTLPYAFVPAYWILARNRFAGYREAVRSVGRQHRESLSSIEQELLTPVDTRTTSLVSPLEQVADVLDTPISTNNQFSLLVDGQQFLDALLEQIASAEHYIYAEFYIIRDDKFGNRFADALIAQAESGKVVRLLYDEVGCIGLSASYIRRLTEAGVDAIPFNTRQGWVNRFQLNFRNHRKLLVVDGQRAVTGGLNIGDEYLGNHDWVTRWRDTAIAIQGPLVRKIQAVFAADYYWAKRHGLPEAKWQDRDPKSDNSTTESTSYSAICATGPADNRARATMMFAAAANAATERLWISTPYLVPDESTVTALSMARAKGVDVRLLIPNQADLWLVYLAGFYYEAELKSLGIEVHRYTDGFLHQKCVLVDDKLAIIGSTNLDNRSLYLNFEMMVAIDQPDFVREVAEMLRKDFASSTVAKVPGPHLQPWYGRFGTVVARLFSPIL